MSSRQRKPRRVVVEVCPARGALDRAGQTSDDGTNDDVIKCRHGSAVWGAVMETESGEMGGMVKGAAEAKVCREQMMPGGKTRLTGEAW